MELFCITGGMLNSVAALENNFSVPQKLSMELPYDPAISISCYIPTKNWKQVLKLILVHTCSFSSICNSQKVETTQKANKGWMDRQKSDLHTTEYFSAVWGMKYWYMLQHGRYLKILCKVKAFKHKKLHIVYLHLYEISRLSNPQR